MPPWGLSREGRTHQSFVSTQCLAGILIFHGFATGFHVDLRPWELPRLPAPWAADASQVQGPCARSVRFLCKRCASRRDDSRSVHRVSEQMQKRHRRTRHQVQGSRSLGKKQSSPRPHGRRLPSHPGWGGVPLCFPGLHPCPQEPAPSLRLEPATHEDCLKRCLVTGPAVSPSFPRQGSHLRFLRRSSTKAPSHRRGVKS